MNVLDKNWVLLLLWHQISSNFSFDDHSIDNPFFMCNNDRTFKHILLDNPQSKLLQKIKLSFINKPYKSNFISIKLFDSVKTLSFIDPASIEPHLPDNLKLIYDNDQIIHAIKYLSDNKIINDSQLRILREINYFFNIHHAWYLSPKPNINQSITNDSLDIYGDDIDKIKFLFSQPYPTFFEHIKSFDKDLVDQIVIAEEHKYFKNPNLPTPVLPLLVRETMTAKDWKPFKLSYRQMYKAYNSLNKQFVFNAVKRQGGKTRDAVRDAYQHILQDKTCNVIYVCQNETVFSQPREYFKMILKKAKDYNIISITETDYTITCTLTNNTIRFVSASSDMGPRSYNWEVFIRDEWGYIKDKSRYDAFPIIKTNNSKCIVNSTISRDMKKNKTERFYRRLVEIELWIRKNAMAMRVNVDQIEWLNPESVAEEKQELKSSPERYNCELYCVVPSYDNTVFPNWFFILWTHKDISDVIIWRDIAKRFDTAWIVCLDQKTWTVFEERKLTNSTYKQQVQIITDLKILYNAKVVADVTNDDWMLEYERWLIDYAVHITPWKSSKKDKRLIQWVRRWFFSKESLIEIFSKLAEEWKVKALSYLNILMSEASNYLAKETTTWHKYEAVQWNDDVVSAVLIATAIYHETYLTKLHLLEKHHKKKIIRGDECDFDELPYNKQQKNLTKERMKNFIL